MRELKLPLSDEIIGSLNAGEPVRVSGTIYTARDAAHKRLVEIIEAGGKLPFDITGQVVFYAGPAPARPGKPIGSVGPTTSGRMDLYSPLLISMGLKVMIGKGPRGREVVDAIIKSRGLYLAAIGGVAALMAKSVKSAKLIAFEDLGPEAIMVLLVEKLPLVVAIDSRGRDLYKTNLQ